MSRGQFYRRTSTNIRAVDNVERESAVRAYCEQMGTTWALQVRGPMKLRGGREGKDFVVAIAHLDRAELQALRDSIDHFLAGEDLPNEADETKVSP